jgi:hypothetical protein
MQRANEPRENDIMAEETKIPDAPKEPFKVTDDFLRKLDDKSVKMSDLTSEQRSVVMEHLKADSDAAPAETSKPAESPKEPEQKAKETPAPEHKEDTPPLDLASLRKNVQKEANEANRLEQLADKLKKQKERKANAEAELKKIREEKAAPPTDTLDETHQLDLHQKNQELQKRLERLEKDRADEDQAAIDVLEKEVNEVAHAEVFKDLKALQGKYPAIKTETPIEKLNENYTAWLDNLVTTTKVAEQDPKADQSQLRMKALEKWNTDATLQQTMPPIAEMDKLDILLKLHQRKQQNGGTVRGYWLEMLEDGNVLDSVVQRARVETAKETNRANVAALTKPETETLSPTDGHSNNQPGGEMTEDKARATIGRITDLQRQGVRVTPAQREENRKAVAFLSGQHA